MGRTLRERSTGATRDYDAPRPSITADDGLQDLHGRRSAPNLAAVDIDENDLAAAFMLPGADLLDEEMSVAVIPMQADEFRCGRCFLVRHRSQQAGTADSLCRDCA